MQLIFLNWRIFSKCEEMRNCKFEFRSMQIDSVVWYCCVTDSVVVGCYRSCYVEFGFLGLSGFRLVCGLL
jgi:hypothetical protein